MPFQKQQNLPATTGAPASAKPRRSKALGNSRAMAERVALGAVLSVLAFWQGDELSEKLNTYLDDARLWPVDGVLAFGAAVFGMLHKKVPLKHKVAFAAPLAVYGMNAVWSARTRNGVATP